MIIEHLENLYRREAAERQEKPNNPFRASSMGRCIREGCFDLLGLEGEALQPRRMAVFKHGDAIHDALTRDLRAALGERFIDPSEIIGEYIEIDGAKIGFHIDGAFKHEYTKGNFTSTFFEYLADISKSIGIIEIKTMSDFAFNKALKGEIDHDYLCQAWVYFKGTDFNPVVFLAYRKETSAMVEIIFDRHANEKVVTQTLTGDPIELAKRDPILLTEIRSPFDESVEEYVKSRIFWLETVRDNMLDPPPDIEELVQSIPGKDAVEDEVEKVQGLAKAIERANQLSIDVKSFFGNTKVNGSWYTLPTGRQILGFPCSYCQHKARCYPTAQMEMKGDRPIWVIP